MFKLFTVTAIIGLFAACASPDAQINNGVAAIADSSHANAGGAGEGMGYFKIAGDSLVIPPFTVEINLSRKANEKLANDKETIIVAAWFSGTPKDSTSKEYAESGEIFIQSSQAELGDARTANFEGVKFSKAKYDSLADKDIRVLINIYSGRKSVPDNLLDCAILSDKMSVVKNRKFVLAGKLIGEPDSLQQKF